MEEEKNRNIAVSEEEPALCKTCLRVAAVRVGEKGGESIPGMAVWRPRGQIR